MSIRFCSLHWKLLQIRNQQNSKLKDKVGRYRITRFTFRSRNEQNPGKRFPILSWHETTDQTSSLHETFIEERSFYEKESLQPAFIYRPWARGGVWVRVGGRLRNAWVGAGREGVCLFFRNLNQGLHLLMARSRRYPGFFCHC